MEFKENPLANLWAGIVIGILGTLCFTLVPSTTIGFMLFATFSLFVCAVLYFIYD